MSRYVYNLEDLCRTDLKISGGKGANLGELFRIEGIRVPAGFCLTTGAYHELTDNHPELSGLLDELSACRADDRDLIRTITARMRTVIETIPIPAEMAAEISSHLNRFPEQEAFAVRSSATAEDLPTASFAGQQDTFLNIRGEAEMLNHIRKCWASLYTDRAVIYRIQNGFGHSGIGLAVIIQQMIVADAAGTLFTADPVTSSRKVVSIDAGYGLGEALVAGLVNPDNYRVADGKIISKSVSAKNLAIYAAPGGGTARQEVAPDRRDTQVLTDEQILRLEQQGRMIEAYFGRPQDIEWCLNGDSIWIVQSRPVTTLYPIPDAPDDDRHVYLSVGHNQMMTDAMKPLGLSFFLLTTRAPMRKAGGRLFIDITHQLRSKSGRESLITTIGKSDPLTRDALLRIFERNLIEMQPPSGPDQQAAARPKPPATSQADPEPSIVAELIRRNQESIEELGRQIVLRSGTAVFDFILEDLQQLKNVMFTPENMQVIMAAINASTWINDHMLQWLGEKNAADIISQSVPNNITSAMGLELLDLADVIRPYPRVVSYLRQVRDEDFLQALPALEGGPVVRAAINAYLEKYGMRCAGEIDITRPRWSEKPATLLPVLLGHIGNFGPGAAAAKFELGLREASAKEQDLLNRLTRLPDGDRKARQTQEKIALVRSLVGYREYPKYGIVSRYWIYKQALLREAGRLVRAGVIREETDVYYLTFEEFRDAVRTGALVAGLIPERKEEFRYFEKLTPPRVITSDGEIITGNYNRDGLPPGALAGLPVSSGIIEGRARVILSMEDARMEDGDILVTTFTDPSWTPLFVSVRALVTEVGGLTTHGAVIAREYGLPAVVGVEHATRLIRDGQRIRVNGTDGYVELMDS